MRLNKNSIKKMHLESKRTTKIINEYAEFLTKIKKKNMKNFTTKIKN